MKITSKILQMNETELEEIANECATSDDFVDYINGIMCGWEQGLSPSQEVTVRDEYHSYVNREDNENN